MLEVLLCYVGLPLYPVALAVELAEDPLLIVGWLLCGLVVLELLRRFGGRHLRPVWFALWLMPGTIICGSGTFVPWPMATVAALRSSPCTTATSVLVCLGMNLTIVFAVVALYRMMRARRGRITTGWSGRER